MAKMYRWLSRAADLRFALRQAIEEGRMIPDPAVYKRCIAETMSLPEDDPSRESRALEITDDLESLPFNADAERAEPSDFAGIRRARPTEDADAAARRASARALGPTVLGDKIHGAWLGRCCGCLLGQPVEGWRRDRILGLLDATGNLPITQYLSSDIGPELRTRFEVVDEGQVYGGARKNWINNISHAPEDDDTNYTVLALKLMEKSGDGFTAEDVSEAWLMNMPLLHACTAERVAYVNLSSGFPAPESARRRNPYREWIGAQIRGDLFGYVRPGDPEAAAGLAFRDASISHVKNGIYGELFAAAMISVAAVECEPARIVRAGLSQIPATSRLAVAVYATLDAHCRGADVAELLGAVYADWDEAEPFDWCHVIPNALIVTVALLSGDLHFARTIGIAVEAGFDTDCNASTVGSIVGMARGATVIPDSWKAPLNDRLKTGIDGFDLPSISGLAARTAALARISA